MGERLVVAPVNVGYFSGKGREKGEEQIVEVHDDCVCNGESELANEKCLSKIGKTMLYLVQVAEGM